MFKITLRGFKPEHQDSKQVLGELESAVMEILWQQPHQTVIEVEEQLRKNREIAHTTVLTTLDRMHRKGYLSRTKESKAFVYSPCYSKTEFEKGLAQEVLASLLGGLSESTISAFVDLVGQDDSKLDRLETLIKAKREERK
ncbi:MAG: BlaI/MecI/CopY family transcriptional regulator [Blastocatellia bacterium]